MFKTRKIKNVEAKRIQSKQRKRVIEEKDDDVGDFPGGRTQSERSKKMKSTAGPLQKPTREVDFSKSRISRPEEDTKAQNFDLEKRNEDNEHTKGKDSLKPLSKNVQVTTIMDFQPDICKDFWKTGYCGYGDTCKFLHVRDESRQRKPIDKDWETVLKNNSPRKNSASISEKIPHKCVLCKKSYDSPIKTSCGHFFCQACFLKRYKKEKKTKCYICGKETDGIFSPVLEKELHSIISG